MRIKRELEEETRAPSSQEPSPAPVPPGDDVDMAEAQPTARGSETPSPAARPNKRAAPLDDAEPDADGMSAPAAPSLTHPARKKQRSAPAEDESEVLPAAGEIQSAPYVPAWAPRCKECIRLHASCDRNGDQLICTGCKNRSVPCEDGPRPPNATGLLARGFGPPPAKKAARRQSSYVNEADAPSARLRRRSEPIPPPAPAAASSGPAKASEAAKGQGNAAKSTTKVLTYGAKAVGVSGSNAPASSVAKPKSAAKGPPLRRVSAPAPKASGSKPAADSAVAAAPASASAQPAAKKPATKKAAKRTSKAAASASRSPAKAAAPAVAAPSPVKAKPKSKPRSSTVARPRSIAPAPQPSDALAEFIAAHIDQDTAPYIAALAAAGVSHADQLIALTPSELAELVGEDEVRDSLSAIQRVLLRSRAAPHLTGDPL